MSPLKRHEVLNPSQKTPETTGDWLSYSYLKILQTKKPCFRSINFLTILVTQSSLLTF